MEKTMERFNEEFVVLVLSSMPEDKKRILRNALERNEVLTSARTLETGVVTVYREGWYIELDGTRCGFKVFILDNDIYDDVGDTPFKVIRKPRAEKLHPIGKYSVHMFESDFDCFF